MPAETYKTIPVSCNRDCGAGCPLIAHVRGGKLVRITNNPLKDPDISGCIRGFRMPDTVYSDQRLKKPLLREGQRGSGTFREISWQEALDRIAEKLGEIREKHGPLSVHPFDGSGSCRGAVHNTELLTKRFFSLFGGYTGRIDSYSSAAAAFVEKYLFGTRMVGFDPPTLKHLKRIILWGANIADTRFSCRIESIIRRRKKDGIPVVVIDPRRSATVKKLASKWIPINPGTDTAMMAAVLHVLISEGYADLDFTEKYTVGFKDLVAYINGESDGIEKSPKWAEPICGVSADCIVEFARAYGKTKPTALLPGLSIQRALGGEETYRFAVALQAATANIGILGGTSGAEFWGKLPVPFFPQMPVPAPALFHPIPVYRWPDIVLNPTLNGLLQEIKAIYNTGTNYLSQGSDIKKNIDAFMKVDFVVTHDFFMTPTARFSDIVLPVTTYLEREDVVLPADNFLFFSAKAIEPLYESRNDYDIFCELADRLGFGKEFSENRTGEEWLKKFLQESSVEDIEQFRNTGIYRGTDQMRVAFSSFIENPETNPLNTPSGRIEIRSEAYSETGFSPLPECRIYRPDAAYPLRLITPHARCRVNSQNWNLSWARRFEPQTLDMHIRDGQARGIKQGETVRVFSPEGEMTVRVNLTEDIIEGTACLLQGAWTERDQNGVERAGAVNALTSTTPTLPSQGARTHSVFVEVTKG
ncbi:MAG: molybdopterin-dependent oxidoreductase [Deltaproteobacteria bacterium]|nr:molybdopterin-dependent oxidoreductase [Deltaproteobacteria bacterium]